MDTHQNKYGTVTRLCIKYLKTYRDVSKIFGIKFVHRLPLEIFFPDAFVLITKCYIILPLVLYGCDTWSLTLREGHRLRVFENRVLKKIFGPKREEVTGEGKRLRKQ